VGTRATTGSQPVLSAVAGFVGTTLEWYDYFLYGTAAALVFNRLFFPTLNPAAGTLAALATFAAAFVLRPVGGILFGHLGDRYSRKNMLVATLLIMAVGTFLIGCLPTYHQIGLWAPALLVVMRMLQGIGLGGEWGGAALITVEHARQRRRGLFGSSMQMGVPAGLLLSTAALDAASALPGDQFLTWGWRLPFLFSVVLCGVGLYVRVRLTEPRFFEEVVRTGARARIPLVDALTAAWRPIVLLIFVQAATNIGYYVYSTYSVAYVTGVLHLSRASILNALLGAAAADLIAQPLFGALSDRVGRRPVYGCGAAFIGLWAFGFFWLLDLRQEGLIWLAMVVALGLGHASTSGLQGPLYSEQFPTRIRYTGASLGFQLSGLVTAAPAPALAAYLVQVTGGSTAVAAYVLAAAVVSVVCVALLRETHRVALGTEVAGQVSVVP
jgi:MHS family shikimate/dehydroshikimate transporter-like MFS transporter